MVEVRKAKGDTLEFHKVTTICAKIMPMKETCVFMDYDPEAGSLVGEVD
uniref:Uncharacterized protein n=1 Tax=Arundo donax TaxID=35708 RepID=A0A0A9G771_ARUDO